MGAARDASDGDAAPIAPRPLTEDVPQIYPRRLPEPSGAALLRRGAFQHLFYRDFFLLVTEHPEACATSDARVRIPGLILNQYAHSSIGWSEYGHSPQ